MAYGLKVSSCHPLKYSSLQEKQKTNKTKQIEGMYMYFWGFMLEVAHYYATQHGKHLRETWGA